MNFNLYFSTYKRNLFKLRGFPVMTDAVNLYAAKNRYLPLPSGPPSNDIE